MRSLSWKLGGALLLIVVVSVGLMAFITNLSTTREFQEYVSQGNVMYAQRVEDTLSQFYAQEGSWGNAQDLLNNLLRSGNDRLIVADNSGIIVGDTVGEWLGRDTAEAGIDNGNPISIDGQEVGKLYLLASGVGDGRVHTRGRADTDSPIPVLNTAEKSFLSRINSSLWVAGLIAAVVALLVGLLLTRQITRPIRALSSGASQIARGNLEYRVKVDSNDELGDLAQSFNSMVSSLDKSEQSRQQLMADIAHELRTPLTVIEGTVNGILDGVFEADNERLGSVKEQTALLTKLISDLRDLSLAESGQLKLELAPTNVVELVRRKLSQVELRARERDIQLKLNTTEIPDINADSTRLEQVLANLLTNAIRHTPAGGNITITVEAVTSDNVHQIMKPSVIISVADTGEGIAPEHLTNVFERFYRAGESRARSKGGTGLGLAIVKQMVQAHGGKVWAESEVGKGSMFYVVLPLSDL